MRRCLLALIGALSLLSGAPTADAQPLVYPTYIEGRHRLGHFRAALRDLEEDPSRRVRVLHFGDSNVAADLWTDTARRALQTRFGNGGNGYLLPGRHGSFHRGDVDVRTEGHWETRRLGFGREYGPMDGLWGLAGVAIEPIDPRARLIIDVPAARAERVVELHLLGRPRPGGRVAVRIDGGEPEMVDLHTDAPGLILRRWTVGPGTHRVIVRPVHGRPRVLGVVVERTSGVVYDVLGINGHRGNAVLRWDERLLRAQLHHRTPDLVVFSYGGNEALDPAMTVETYAEQLHDSLERFRDLMPQASCLVVGPVATVPQHASRMQSVTDMQRRLAPEHGCAFFDSSRVSGGHGRLHEWARHPSMVAGDNLHLGRLGYRVVGEQYVHAILGGV